MENVCEMKQLRFQYEKVYSKGTSDQNFQNSVEQRTENHQVDLGVRTKTDACTGLLDIVARVM